MLLGVGVFLLSVLCGFIPCEPKYEPPEIRSLPIDSLEIDRNIEKQNVEPIVKLPVGIIEGYLMKASSGRSIFAFEGIPYGESTAGSRRWKSPVPKRPWRGILKAKKPGSDCLQISLIHMLRVYGSEDCLYLNVFTPNLPDSKDSTKFSVVVFIHGGAFMTGSGSEYGPSYILTQDVVLVTLNYRLGVLGFLSTGDEVLPGNYGMKDQALALKWVHENIAHFNGNPQNVSIWGNSAGGGSVHLHMISNKTREYFSTALSSSGTALSDWTVQSRERTTYIANRLGKPFGCQNIDSRVLAKCLERVNPNVLVVTQYNLFDWYCFPLVIFSPVVEPEHADAFLTITPEKAYKTGTVAKKPFVVGMMKDEGHTLILLMILMARMIPLRHMWKQIAPHFLDYNNNVVDNPDEITRLVEDFYFKRKSARYGSLNEFSKMLSDRYFNVGIVRGLQAHVNFNASTYLYYFSFSNGNHNLGNIIGYKSSEWGAGHAEDVFYFFNKSLVINGHKQTDPDHELSSIMINLLVNFAGTGEPQYRSDTNKFLKIWDPVQSTTQLKALQLDKEVKMISFPENEIRRLKFWDKFKIPHHTLLSPL